MIFFFGTSSIMEFELYDFFFGCSYYYYFYLLLFIILTQNSRGLQ